MPAPAQTALAEYRLFEALGEPCGVLLVDPATGRAGFRFRQDWDQVDAEEAETLRAIAGDLPAKLDEMGGPAFLAWIDETLSNAFRVLPPRATLAGTFERTLQAIYRRHVKSSVRQYVTHLPLLSLPACAGGLGPDMEARVDAWIEAEVPGRKRLDKDLFLVRIEGHSMEPEIPDGSLCVFRRYYAGSRKGKIVLVKRTGAIEEGGEVTVKRYDSVWEAGEQKQIAMHPDNPEYAAWDLKPGERWQTLGEFVCVLEDPEP
jgi:SOS-response transcriptional repressor LexA